MQQAIPLLTLPRRARTHRAATAPEPAPRRLPVFIQDAVTPWGEETVLLALLHPRKGGTRADDL